MKHARHNTSSGGMRVVLIASVCVAVALAIVICGRLLATRASQSSQSQTQADATNATNAKPESQPNNQQDAPGEKNSASADDQSASQNSSDAGWEQNVESFLLAYMTWMYPSDTSATGAETISVEEWASRCMPYVDPDSSLGETLASDPEAQANTVGYYEVACQGERVVLQSREGNEVLTDVTFLGTQNTYADAREITFQFRVSISDDGLITDVELVGT